MTEAKHKKKASTSHRSSTHKAAAAEPAVPTLDQPVDDDLAGAVTWEASEYLHHEKSAGWFLIFSIFGALLSIVLFFVVDWFSALVIALMVIVLIVYANRKPRTLSYAINELGIQVDDRVFSFTDFRSFTIFQEGGLLSVVLQPMRRFMPPLTLYFTNQQGEQILDILSIMLPHEEREPDLVDKLVRRLRF